MVFTHNDLMWIVTLWTVDGKETRGFILLVFIVRPEKNKLESKIGSSIPSEYLFNEKTKIMLRLKLNVGSAAI